MRGATSCPAARSTFTAARNSSTTASSPGGLTINAILKDTRQPRCKVLAVRAALAPDAWPAAGAGVGCGGGEGVQKKQPSCGRKCLWSRRMYDVIALDGAN